MKRCIFFFGHFDYKKQKKAHFISNYYIKHHTGLSEFVIDKLVFKE